MDRHLELMTTRSRWRKLQRYPCMADELMDAAKSPSVTLKNLAVPRLRKCPFDIDTIDWQRAKKLGVGADGCVYRVYFGDQGPFALKLFWIPDLIPEYPYYSAVHRECQNAALLQMLRASIDQSAAAAIAIATAVATDGTPDGPTVPPLVRPSPMNYVAASGNLMAFSDEARRDHQVHAAESQSLPPELVPVTSMPRFAKCNGWLPCNVHELMEKMPRRIRACGFEVDRHEYREFDDARTDFFGIVYEYIRSNDCDGVDGSTGEERRCPTRQTTAPGEKTTAPVARRYNTRSSTKQAADRAVTEAKEQAEKAEQALKARQAATAAKDAKHRERVSAVADFLWLAGFEFCGQPLARNWKNGVLVDHSDIIGPCSSGWQRGGRNTKWSLDWLLTPSQ